MARLQGNIEKLKAQGSEDDSDEKVSWYKHEKCVSHRPTVQSEFKHGLQKTN